MIIVVKKKSGRFPLDKQHSAWTGIKNYLKSHYKTCKQIKIYNKSLVIVTGSNTPSRDKVTQNQIFYKFPLLQGGLKGG